MALTNTGIQALKAADKPDGQGLILYVQPNGSKWWRFRYRFNGTPKMISFGTYPEVSLAQARLKRDDARAFVADDIDPSVARQDKKAQAKLKSANTFKAVANDWHALHNKNKSERHQQRVRRWLDVYLFPLLGDKAVSDITAPMVLITTDELQKQGKLETAHRVIQTAGQVFRYAIQKGFANYNPAPDLKGALPPPIVKNMAAMIEPKDVASLLRSIDGYRGTLTVQCALKLAPLIFQRIGELRHMKWVDLDFERNEWRYLVTKTKTEHIVPLFTQAVDITLSQGAVFMSSQVAALMNDQ